MDKILKILVLSLVFTQFSHLALAQFYLGGDIWGGDIYVTDKQNNTEFISNLTSSILGGYIFPKGRLETRFEPQYSDEDHYYLKASSLSFFADYIFDPIFPKEPANKDKPLFFS